MKTFTKHIVVGITVLLAILIAIAARAAGWIVIGACLYFGYRLVAG